MSLSVVVVVLEYKSSVQSTVKKIYTMVVVRYNMLQMCEYALRPDKYGFFDFFSFDYIKDDLHSSNARVHNDLTEGNDDVLSYLGIHVYSFFFLQPGITCLQFSVHDISNMFTLHLVFTQNENKMFYKPVSVLPIYTYIA